MKLDYTDEQRAFRKQVRAWMEANVPSAPLPSFDLTREGFEAHRDWERRLNDGRWGMVTWPEELGGRGLDLIRWLIFEEEYYRAGAPTRVNQNGIFLLGPTMMEFGTDEQKARFLPRMAAGDDIWAQAWSEPGAGSDLAAVRSTATRDGDHYILNGQKIWSSRAVFADWAFGLFREPGSERHKGMSLILFPLDAPGVTRRPIARMDGKLVFAEIFLDNVRVPVADRLGDEGQGWHVCMATAGFERGLMLRSPARYQVAASKLIALYEAHKQELPASFAERVAKSWMDADAYALSIYATASKLQAGGKIGPESSTNKIFWSELDIDLTATALDILGERAELMPGAPAAGDIDTWLDDYIFALAGPIYAGSNEIQRNIIAERMLETPQGLTAMHFAYTEDQLAITEAARGMLVETCTPRDLRRMLDTGDARDEDRWTKIRDMGLIGMLAPESAGGLGLDLPDFIGIAEAAGYVALPEPLVALAGIAVPLLGGIENDRGWLARAMAGETVAIGHPFNLLVADADSAGALLMGDGQDIHLVDASDVHLTRSESVDPCRRLFSVQWAPSAATRLGIGWGATGERGAILAAAEMIGLAQRLIDMSVGYAMDRTQFGKPIGSYQAVKHMLATAQVKIEFARPVVQAAAAELALGSLAARARAAHAKIAAGEAAELAARTAVQVHGAMGMTWEVDVHFFLKRALALKNAWGTPAMHGRTIINRITSLPTGPDATFASEIA